MPIPKLVVAIATTAMQMALTASQRIKGPRLDDLKVPTADYGTPRQRFIGTRRLECPIVWSKKLREEKHTSKTKGGKYENYKYFWTGGVEVADQVSDDIARIWMDKKLVYDRTKAGPVSVASLFRRDPSSTGPIKLSSGKNMRFALGGEDQEPDPAYTAFCEDRYGSAAAATAFRGKTLIHFEDLPVEKFGNRVPMTTVEAVSLAVPTFPYESATTVQEWDKSFCFSPDFSAYAVAHNGVIDFYDTASRALMLTATAAWPATAGLAMDSAGRIYGVGAGGTHGAVWVTEAYGGGGSPLYNLDAGADTVVCLEDVIYAFWKAGSPSTYMVGGISFPLGFPPEFAFLDIEGNHWFVGYSGSDVAMRCVAGARAGASAAFESPAGGAGGTLAAIDNGTDFVFCQQATPEAILWKVDRATLTIIQTGLPNGGNANAVAWANTAPGSATVWNSASEVSLDTLEVVRTNSGTGWPGIGFAVYDPICDALIAQPVAIADSATIYHLFLDRIAGGSPTLGDWVTRVCGWCGLTGIDVSQLTQPIAGFSVTPGTGKDMIDPLLTIHDVDARSNGFQLQFVNRGSAPDGSIATGAFVRDRGQKPYTAKTKQDTDLPKMVRVNFADANSDQQPNNVLSPLPADAVDSQRDETIDLSTYVATPDQAQQLADRYVRRVWNSRETIEATLTAQEMKRLPGDVTTVYLDGVGRNARIDRMTLAGGRLQCSFIRDETSLAALNGASGPAMDGRDEETIFIPGPSKGFVIDAPLRSDADADVKPLLLAGAGPYLAGSWPGAGLYRGDDGTYDDLTELFDSTQKATWGLANDVLADVPSPWLWDRGNSLNAALLSGTLTNATEAEIDADPSLNLLLVGATGRWEYVQFTNAALQPDGTYTLSGFKRGRRGTEWATGMHEAGDAFVLASTLAVEELGLDEAGAAMSFKVQSLGRDVEAAAAIDLAPFTAATLKPYAPAAVQWVFDGTDLQGTIVRRTRLGGAWIGGTTIPLSENAETYEIDVAVAGTVVRTISVSGTNGFAYTAAMAAEDGVTLPAPPSVNVYQLSDAVGRGFALAA